MLQCGGAVVIRMLENIQQATIYPFIQRFITPGTRVRTDEYLIYSRLPEWGFDHHTVGHGRGEYARDKTEMAFTRLTSTPPRDSGRCCAPGCDPIGESRRIGI